jgi:predicted dehydrogenase
VNLISTHTNRNTDNGAWQYNLYPDQPDSSIDWDQFVGGFYDGMPLSREIFFRWRKYWKFGSGLTGDLLSHEFDSMNAIMEMGIPKYVTTSGGIYTHRDGREVPDVMHVSMEYPDYFLGSSQAEGKEKGMTFHYSASLGNQYSRKAILMGHDGTMELGQTLQLRPDPHSTRYREQIQSGLINPAEHMYAFDPARNRVDAVSSATTQYFAEKGLLFDYRDGKVTDVTHLHMKEWLHCIRTGEKPSCSIKEGFEEAIASLMATLAFKTGRRVEYDHENDSIVVPGMEGADLDRLLIS